METYKLKIYLKSKRKPIIIETNSEKIIIDFFDHLNTNHIIKIGPVMFALEEFKFATIE